MNSGILKTSRNNGHYLVGGFSHHKIAVFLECPNVAILPGSPFEGITGPSHFSIILNEHLGLKPINDNHSSAEFEVGVDGLILLQKVATEELDKVVERTEGGDAVAGIVNSHFK